jgi:molecular chaperone DnaK (HSP70)
MRLGIDFGTTRTVVSGVDEGRYPIVTFELDGELRDHLPGCAVAIGDGLRFGPHAAELATRGDAVWATDSVKRSIGGLAPDDPVPGLPGTTALDLVGAYLHWLRRTLLEHSNVRRELAGAGAIEAMVAVPAQAGTRQRYVTLEAFRRAGFAVLGVLNEPTAAAIEYALRHVQAVSERSPKEYGVVYDLGGGTFDTAAVSLRGRRFELLASSGSARLGGADFDACIVDLALAHAGADASEIDPRARVALLERAREAKEGLRPNSRKLLVDLAAAGLDPVVLDAAEVYDACEPMIGRTVGEVQHVLDDLAALGVDVEDPRKLGAIYTVGGSAAFVPALRMLRARFGRKILLAPQPHAATAVGLAVAADPDAAVFVREAPTRMFGVWREADHGREKVFDPILGKADLPEADAPIVVERRYRPSHAIGHLRFLECSALDRDGQPSGDLVPWEEIRFPYDPGLVDHGELATLPVERQPGLADEIVETYTHGSDGTIEVAIENRTHGYRRVYPLGALR